MVRTSLIVLLVAAAVASTLATKYPNEKKSKTFVPGAYVFELEDGYEPAALEEAVGKHGSTRMKLNYDLYNGISIQLHDIDKADQKVAELASLPAVRNVVPLALYRMPAPKVEWTAKKSTTSAQGSRSSLASNETAMGASAPHVMMQIDQLHAKNITGKGVKIAMIDSGVDYKHPALGGCFGRDCLVSFGTDLVGDAYTGENTPHPDPDPMDCAGHGTHVAGILAAQKNSYGFTGAAPGVKLGIYRTFGCQGHATNDVLIAAFNKAYQDGANIITASLGLIDGWPEEALAEAVSRIVDKGVPCIVAAGNDGGQGMFAASTSADGRHVAAIASYNNVETPILLQHARYQVGNGTEASFGHVPSKSSHWDGVALPVWANSFDPTVPDDGCVVLPSNTTDLSRQIVLLRRGGCEFSVKISNVMAKGAKNVIVYNNAEGAYEMDLRALPAGTLNAASMVDAETGLRFVNALKTGKKLTLKMADAAHTGSHAEFIPNTASGGALSVDSSWGPTWEMGTKPQYGAPGGQILSTYPLALGGYAVLSGTSMACPQVAGVVALLHEVRGTYDPALLQNLLSANAKPRLFNDGARFYDFLAPVPQQGAGLIQAHDAAYATTLLSPSSLSFNDTDHFAKNLKFELRNTAHSKTTYNITHVPSIAVNTFTSGLHYIPPFPNGFSYVSAKASAALSFSETSITLNGGESKTIRVAATAPSGLDATRLPVWSGYIAINGTDGSALCLPYQGLTGSLRDATVLNPDAAYVYRSTDPQAQPVPPNSTFQLPSPGSAASSSSNGSLPVFAVNLALGSSVVRIDFVPLGSSDLMNKTTTTTEFLGVKTIGQPFSFPLRWTTRGRKDLAFDGRLDSGKYAPPGKYQVLIRALRIFGDQANKQDWDTSSAGTIRITYK